MVSDTLEQRIYELVRSHDGIYLFKKKELTPSTDLDSDLRLEDSTYNKDYVKCTRTFKRHVKAAGFVHAKKLLAHKFDPFPTVTLREFC